jgi:hypothetical protein
VIRAVIYDVKDSTYTLTTGRRVYANRGILGIDEHGHVSEGYDGGVELERDWDDTFQPWTPAERAELADEMIRRWSRFKSRPPDDGLPD